MQTPGMEQIVATKKWWQNENDGDSDEEGGDKNKPKWKTLEHHGVTFYPPYQPHGVKVLHKVCPFVK